MYDFVRAFTKKVPHRIQIALGKNNKESVFYKGVEYGYNGSNSTFPIYTAKLDNLVIQHSLAGSRVFNSIHKYYDGYNNTDFSLSAVKHAFEKLCDETLIDWRKANVVKLECGCNTLEDNNNLILGNIFSYGRKYFIPMNEIPYRGAKCRTTNFTLKSYNKFIETPNWFNPKTKLHRSEIRYERVKKSFPFINSVEDLYSTENALLLRKDFLSRFQKVVFLEMPDLFTLSIKDKTIIARYSNPLISDAFKKQHPQTFKIEIERFKVLMKNDTGFVNNYLKNIAEKTEELIYS